MSFMNFGIGIAIFKKQLTKPLLICRQIYENHLRSRSILKKLLVYSPQYLVLDLDYLLKQLNTVQPSCNCDKK